MMKMLLFCCAGCAVMLACIAHADIPSYVDFHAVFAIPEEGAPPTWTIVANEFGSADPEWQVGGSQLYIDDKSSGLQVKQLWLQIEFVDAAAADPWKDEPGNPAPYYPAAYGYDQDQNIFLPESWAVDVSDDGSIITWEWGFILEPEYERVLFGFGVSSFPNVGSLDYDGDGDRDIEELAVASYVIPLPSSLLLCVIGMGCTVLTRRFRR